MAEENGSDEYINKLAEEYGHDVEKVTKDWDNLEEMDLVKSQIEKGMDGDLLVYRMLRADYSVVDIGRTETYNVYILQPSGAFKTKAGQDMITITSIGMIPSQKKFGIVRIIGIGTEHVNAMQKLQRGKLYKAELGVGDMGDKVMTAWWQDSSKATMHKDELPEQLKDPLALLDKLFTTTDIMDWKNHVGQDGNSPTLMIEGQVVTSTTRKKKTGGMLGFYRLRDDSMTREDFTDMGGGLSILVPPEMIDCGRKSTIRAIGNFQLYKSEATPDAQPRVSFVADAIIPVVQFEIKKDVRDKIPAKDVSASETQEEIGWIDSPDDKEE